MSRDIEDKASFQLREKKSRKQQELGDTTGSFGEKGHGCGSNTPPDSPTSGGQKGTSETDWVVIKVRLPRKLYLELMEILTYLGLWKNFSELVRSSLVATRDQRIAEAHQAEKSLDSSEWNPG